MDDVDRMYRHLVRTIRATSPQLLTQPFQVGELYSTILPYRLHRRELGLETNQDYEMAMLELLSGGRGYLAVEERMRDQLGTALKSPNPDPSVIREFASARVALSPEALEKLEPRSSGAPADEASGAPIKEPDTAPFRASAGASTAGQASSAATSTTGARSSSAELSRASGSSASAPSSAASTGTRRAPRPITVSPTGELCPHCKGELPAGRQIIFCPHCGQDLTVLHCPACGSELEHGWKFCVTCGRAATEV